MQHSAMLLPLHEQDLSTPWRPIFISPVMMAIIIGHLANNWGFYTLLIGLSTFLNETLCLNIKKRRLYLYLDFVELHIHAWLCCQFYG